jgi:hypothetical protein
MTLGAVTPTGWLAEQLQVRKTRKLPTACMCCTYCTFGVLIFRRVL